MNHERAMRNLLWFAAAVPFIIGGFLYWVWKTL